MWTCSCGPHFSVVPELFIFYYLSGEDLGKQFLISGGFWQWWRRTEQWLLWLGLSNQMPLQQVVTFGFQLQDLIMISVTQAAENPVNIKTLNVVCLWDSSWN